SSEHRPQRDPRVTCGGELSGDEVPPDPRLPHRREAATMLDAVRAATESVVDDITSPTAPRASRCDARASHHSSLRMDRSSPFPPFSAKASEHGDHGASPEAKRKLHREDGCHDQPCAHDAYAVRVCQDGGKWLTHLPPC